MDLTTVSLLYGFLQTLVFAATGPRLRPDPTQWTTIYPSDVTERNLLANNKEWVFISVDKIAKSVASVRFKVMQYKRNGDDQEVFDGPMVDFLEAPAQRLHRQGFYLSQYSIQGACG